MLNFLQSNYLKRNDLQVMLKYIKSLGHIKAIMLN
jgi:hypothetical protein